jgi:hypothetical protein
MTITKPAVPTGRIMLRNVRLSFAQGLFEASTIPGADAGAKPKYNCGLLLAPDHPQIKEIRTKTIAVAREKWAAKADGILKGLEKQDRLALHDGDVKPNYSGYPGNLFLSPSTTDSTPPFLGRTVDGQVVEMDPKTAARSIYSGCYVDASIELWAQDNQYGQRVNAQLRGVMFVRDGDAFGAGGAAHADEFEPAAEGADAEDMA